MILLYVVSTSKSFDPKDKWSQMSTDTLNFKDKAEAHNYLKNRYGKSKRSLMYVDHKEGPKHIGYTYGFRNEDRSHYPVQKWLQQDWVEFREVTTVSPK